MASLPPRPASQRRSSPRADEAASASDQQPLPRTDSEAFSTTSEDSQTLLLSRRQSHRGTDATETQQKPALPAATSQAESDAEPRKCWICFNDETEDDQMSSEWRSPCPCVLVAHEKCLLAWINDVENEKRGSAKILCPQCKTELQIVRPQSRIVDAYRSIEHMAHWMLLPSVITIVGSAGYQTARMFGMHAVNEIFGVEDGFRILHSLYDAPDFHEKSILIRILNHLRHHWRLDVGLPVIPTVLIASRTSFADSILPVIPIIFFANTSSPNEGLNIGNWPPSAALTISLLPYLRGAYNAYYERVWAPHEQRWLKEISPHTGDTAPEPLDPDNVDGGNNNIQDGWEENEVVLDIDVDFDVFRDWNAGGAADNNLAEENPPVPIARGPAPPLNAPPQEDADGDAAPAPNVPAAPVRRVRRTGINPVSLADTIIGALLFPTIAARVGEVLRFALPHSWTTPNGNKATGLLQTKWGRSIVGGCLFVGVKDAVLLYVRWRMAQNMRQRRVLDWNDDGKGRAAAGRTRGRATP